EGAIRGFHVTGVQTCALPIFAAREALLLAVSLGSRAQREHARSRLYSLSRSLGDELGTRRWKARRPGGLVSLGAGRMAPRERSRPEERRGGVRRAARRAAEPQ